jgi:4-aminobutyrate aminotransferase
VGAPRALMARWAAGSHGGTYGGNALAAAAACATIDVLRDEDLPGRAAAMGAHLTDGLSALQAEYPVIGDVRGRGLMVGVEFTRGGAPDKDTTKVVQKFCLERRLLLLTCGSYENVIRWIPPLTVDAGQIDEALAVFAEALHAARQTHRPEV